MVARSAWLKDTLREIRGNAGRFLSIFAIIAIGTGFFAGVKATGPDMEITADKYFKDTALMDIRLQSTFGFNDKDILAIKSQQGFSSVMPSYSTDALLTTGGGSDIVVKVLALPGGADATGAPLNQPVLVSGRLPQRSGECVVEPNRPLHSYQFQIGDKVQFQPEAGDSKLSDFLKRDEFTIVGFVNSPLYPSFERGGSTVGNGTVSCFMLIPPEDFGVEVYTDVYLKAASTQGLSAFSDEYEQQIDSLSTQLEAVGDSREQGRYDEIHTEAQDKIDDANRKLADAEREKDDKLAKAQRDIADGKAKVADAEKTLADKLAKAQKDIDDAKEKISKGEKELAKGRRQLRDETAKARAQLDAAWQQYNAGKAEYDKQAAAFPAMKQQAEAAIAAAQQQLAALQAQITALAAQIAVLEASAPDAPALPAMRQQLVQMQAQYDAGQADVARKQAELAAAEEKLRQTGEQLAQVKAQLDAKEKQLKAAEAQGRRKLAAGQKQLDEAKKKLDQGEQDYADGKVEAEGKIAKAKADIAQGEKDYAKGKADAEEKIADARGKIEDAQKDLADLKEPKWYVMARGDEPGYSGYQDNAERVDAIAAVFPVFFLVVAGMVCLTTMTRMVEEQRTQIGTMKALGYSNTAIAGKFVAYALLASAAGSVAGLAVGFRLLPTVIYNAYRIMYNLPGIEATVQWGSALGSALAAMGCTTAVALITCRGELASQPASLMRPKAPRPGKRIFLERIGFLWSRFSFISKVTARNLLRYKARFFMTVLGIAGCAALMLAGFGLRDSISVMVPRQYGEIFRYHTTIALREETAEADTADLKAALAADSRVTDAMLARYKAMDAESGGRTKGVTLLVPEDADKLTGFITLRGRLTGQPVALSRDGVVVTEKLATSLGLRPGDSITLRSGDISATARVTGIAENYVYNYVYMPPEVYRASFGGEPLYNVVFGTLRDTADAAQKQFAADWLKRDDIMAVNFNSGISSSFMDTIKSLNSVVLVMIISAGCLAFVVLYNLTNINICERTREIATIKVLGFYNNEVSNYVYRENTILTLLGTALGLALGVLLHRFVILTAEVDMVMFGREIEPVSYLWASVLTVFFAFLVNFVMYFRLKRIDMVESLKSVE